MTVLYKKTLRDMWKSKWFLLGVTLVVMFASIIYFGMNSYVDMQQDSLANEYNSRNLADCNLQFQDESISEENATILLSQYEEIESYELRVKTPILLNLTSAISEYCVTIGSGIGIDNNPTRENTVNSLIFENNNTFSSENENTSLYIEKKFGEKNGLKLGDIIEITIFNQIKLFTILDYVSSPEYLIVRDPNLKFNLGYSNYGIAYFSQNVLRSITGKSDIINDIVLKNNDEYKPNSSAIQNIAEEIKKDIETSQNFNVNIYYREDSASFREVKAALDAFDNTKVMMPVLIYLVAGFGTYVILGRLIRNQRQQIGILISMGYKRNGIIMSFYSIVIVIGLIGGIFGIIGGNFMGGIMGKFTSESMGIPRFEPRFQPQYIFSTFLIQFIILTIAVLLPLIKIMKINPAEAIYKDSNIQFKSSTGIFEKINIKIRERSIWLTMSLRNFFRNRTRSISTILMISIGVGLCIGNLALMRALGLSPFQEANIGQEWDYQFMYSEFQDENQIRNNFSQLVGIENIDYVQFQLVVSNLGQYSNESFRLFGINSNFSAINMEYLKGNSSQLVISEGIANKFNLEIGDPFEIRFLENSTTGWSEKSELLNISGIFDSVFTTTIFLEKEQFNNVFESSNNKVNMVYLSVNENWEEKSIVNLGSILSNPHILGYYNLEEQIESQDVYVDGLAPVYIIIGVIELLIMAVLVGNTISINTIERTHELAILSSMGLTNKQINSTLFLEVILFGLIGALLANPIGQYMGNMMINSIINAGDRGQFAIYEADYGEIFSIIAIALLIVILIEWIVKRYYKKLYLPIILNQRIS